MKHFILLSALFTTVAFAQVSLDLNGKWTEVGTKRTGLEDFLWDAGKKEAFETYI
jgi:hypothetical protein